MQLAQNAGDFIGPLCCGCWVLPILAIVVPYSVIRSIRMGIRMRGVEKGGLYCAKCRFDLRGGVNWTCPECGADLRHSTAPALPLGGILMAEIDLPLQSAPRVAAYLLLGTVPAILAVLVFGMFLPINYTGYGQVRLSPPSDPAYQPPYASEITFGYRAGRSWAGPDGLTDLNCWDLDHQPMFVPDASDKEKAHAYAETTWAEVVDQYPWLLEMPEKDAVRQEWFDLVHLMFEHDQKAIYTRAKHFQVDWWGESEVDYHPLFIVFAFPAVIFCMALLVRRALREGEQAQKKFQDKLASVRDRYGRIVETNQQSISKGPGQQL